MSAHKILRTLPVVALGLLLPTAAIASEWVFDKDHSSVGFSVRHLMVTNVAGKFREFDGLVTLDDKDVTKSKVAVSVDVGSVDTDHQKRDDHLKSPDFFDAEKHPKMTFESTKVVKKGKKLQIHGNLTIRGTTKPVILQVDELTNVVKDPWGNTKRGAVAHTTINRTDFGLTWNKALETGGVVVGEDVKIELQLELVEKKGATKA